MLSKMNGVNKITLVGEVVKTKYKSIGNSLYAKARIRIDGVNTNLVDVYGYGKVAQAMTLACNKGNTVLIEARFENSIRSKENKITSIPYIFVKKVDCLKVADTNTSDSVSTIELLDSLDPMNYLNLKPRPFRKNKKGEK